jgi:RNA polymerase sigma factor (sigma-70 family)
MLNTNFDEKSVIEGCLKNSLRHQKLLYEHFKVQMFTYCLRYATDRAEAEDMLQDGFLSVFKELHQYDASRGALGAWIRRVIINAALQVIRKKKVSFTELSSFYEEIPDAEDAVSAMSAKEILGYITQLPQGYRTVFNMYVIDGMQHNEIADALNISLNTSKTQLFKAKQHLQKIIAQATMTINANY